MKELQLHYPIQRLAKMLQVSRSGYYEWLQRLPSKRVQEDARLGLFIRIAHQRTRETFGTRRLQKELLREEGVHIGCHRLARLRRQLGIRCKQVKKFKATTDSNHTLPVAPNLLEQRFQADRPHQVWVADITYISTQEGWLYLAGIKDLCTREIVGYAMNNRMTEDLTSQALFQAVGKARPGRGLIHHSDRGSQYCAHGYQNALARMGIQASMSRRGNCYDNAPMESFWGTLKNELVHHRRYATRQEAMDDITEYIEVFYNRQRRQSKLGHLSPAEFAQIYHQLHQTG